MGTATTTDRPPLPPFTRESAIQKVRLAEDGWNTRDPAKVALAYTIDSRWRNRSEFINGRSEIIAFLSRKWANELDWEFSDDGLMASRFASINDIPILGSERKYHWVLGLRPDDHQGLSDLGF